MNHLLAIIFSAFAFLSPTHLLGSTITTTNSSDTLNTFRTNTNTNLANLNADKLESGSTAATLTITRLTNTFGSSTAFSATTLCLATDCRTGWPSGITSLSVTYPLSSSGGSTPTLSLAFGTTTANTWSGTQTFTDPSTSFTGIVSPTRALVFTTGTTTTWTGTTSDPYIPHIVAPFSGTIKSSRCSTDSGWIGVDLFVGSTHLTYSVASTTVGTTTYSANNTFAQGSVISMKAGTSTAATLDVSCTLLTIQTS